MGSGEAGFFGSPGLQAPRYSNLILQHTDALLVLGSRMDNMITAFNEEHFAYRAKKVIVDIDKNEIKKKMKRGAKRKAKTIRVNPQRRKKKK